MKTKIMLVLLCLMTSAACFAEWVYLGNVQYIVYGYGYDAPAGRYITSCRFTMTSEPENVYIKFMDESGTVIYSQSFTGVTMGSTYSSSCPIPAAHIDISNGSWGHHSRSDFWVDLADYHAEPPMISPSGGIIRPNAEIISITSSQSSAKIYYTTDGSNPTTLSLPYAGTFSLNSSTTIKAIAVYKSLISGITEKTFQIGWSPPEIFPSGGGFQVGDEVEVIITNSPNNNGEGTIQFRYDSGGSFTGWTNYVNPIIVTGTSTIEAKVAGIDGGSDAVSATYEFVMEKVATPAISPTGGAFTELPAVEISCTTQGAAIYYTTNGTEPSKTSSVYAGAITLTGSCRVKAFAAKTNMGDSDKVSRAYILDEALPKGDGSDEDYDNYLNTRNGLVGQLGTLPNDGTLDDIVSLDDSWKNGGSGSGTGTGDGTTGGDTGGGTGAGTGGGTGDTGGGTGSGGGAGDGGSTGNGGTGSGVTGTGDSGGTSGGGSTSTTSTDNNNYYSTSNTYNSNDNKGGSTDYLGLGSIFAAGLLPSMIKPETHQSIHGGDGSNDGNKEGDSWSKRIFFTK